jgi:hypothetical protein
MLNENMNVVSFDRSNSFVDRHYILLKVHYFLSHSSLSSFGPVLDMILNRRGLSFLEISYINLLIPFIVFFTNPLSGYIADHTRRFRLTFNIIFGLGTLLFLIMFFLPSIKTSDIRGELHQNQTMEYSMIFCANEEFARKCTLRNKCGCIYQAKCIPLTTFYHSKERSKRKTFHFNFTMNEEDIKEQLENLSDKSEKHSTCKINYRVSVNKRIDQNKGNNPFIYLTKLLTNSLKQASQRPFQSI